MNQWNLYHLLMGIIGLSVGFVGFSEILSQGISLGTSLMAVGALAILAQTGYALFIKESSELTESQSVGMVAIGAILCSVGALVHIFV
ncbi:hypothetical protein [Natronococcus sp. A-GB7]|uniref:hypothetical protein n=1 Tax=Natronococcus sp. A-GB7 TaxID=3037649 RepID=UPI00241C52AF|nr:hypothetical protein [Natronococcus sp. A-GB7]MDG5821854.1 hypothetical protein [Natronococcus sp. A-GB7]